MIQAKIINKINFPEIKMQEDLQVIAKNIIIPDIIRGINSRMAINGGSLPANDPATIKRKGSDSPLIDTGELRSSFFFKNSGKNKVAIMIDSGRSKIGSYLQAGIKTNKGIKRYIFFGISRDASDEAMKYARNRVKEITKGGR